MVLIKFGSLPWMDAPYMDLTKYVIPTENKGLALTVYLIENATGELIFIRLLELSTKFSRSLFGEVMKEKMKPFSNTDYYQNI